MSGTVLEGPVILEPSVVLDKLSCQISSIRKLRAILRGEMPPPERDSHLPRLVLALRALDGRAEGASLRELAFGIFGAKDWPGDGENVKSRVRRLVRLSEELRRGGPGGVLSG